MAKCATCGKVVKNALALKIHVGRMHKKAAPPAKVAKGGAFTCKFCGRSFGLAMHLGRHISFAHATGRKARKAGRPAAKRAATPVTASAAEIDVRSLAVDQLIALKQQIDSRLAEVARRLRLAGVMGRRPGRPPGRKPGPKPGRKAGIAPAAPVAKKPRMRGVFQESATEMILGLLKGGKPVSTTEIAAAWSRQGRKGKPSKTLSDMVKAKKIKREVLKGTRANNYTLA
jgi:hypothetical protein